MLADEQGIQIIFPPIGANKAPLESELNRFPKFKRIEILIKWTLFVHNEEGGGGLSGTLATSFDNDTMYGAHKSALRSLGRVACLE
jgi:hypothetical protein